ncbi:two-component system sensor histidine kinase NtrB [Parerythrobacter lacustris]|uniref:histidine kinase n=1 Tax=Parerythrobacter lacustris TaxID=2969984 RepID=A0ABT1XQD7_9SPHN|nr:ATP-binding protein [Parerythrobacter lacustris]MCR2833802.1 ATP-binding protein [Parerythrobacter lacustris]
MTLSAKAPDPRAQISGLVFALIVLDPHFVVVEANPAAEDLLGQSAKRLVGMVLSDLLDLRGSGVENRLDRENAQLIARGVMIGIAGHERRVNLTVSPLSTHLGWRVLTLTDAGQEDMAANSGPDVSLKAPSILAHEIKNPLAAIRGAGQLLARKLEQGDRALTDVISEEVDRIARLIDRMQELGSNTQEPVGPVNLHESIRKAIATSRARPGTMVEFVEEFDPSLPPVLANRDLLEQVLINLIVNAIDACSDRDEPRISIRTRFVSGLAANVLRFGTAVRLPIEVSVADNGPGLDPSLAEHIFEPFVTSKRNGQGLGLPLVKKMVGDMGGRVSHRRDPKAGLTIFKIHLALSDRPPETANG